MGIQIVIDAGNAFVKAVCGKQRILFPHKIAPLMSATEYDDALTRYGKVHGHDFVRLEGMASTVGQTAEFFQVQHLTGAPKYRREYYGWLFASAVARLIGDAPDTLKGGVDVVASHASRDYEFHAMLRDAMKGKWDFECNGTRYRFDVKKVLTYEEPFGGYARCAIVREKRGWSTPLSGNVVGVVDIGGGTCGTLIIDESGTPQYGASASGNQGMNDATERMKSMLKQDFSEMFSRTKEIPVDRVRNALATGRYRGGGRELDVSKQAQMALAPLLNEVERLYIDKLGGGLGLDVLVLTGGGNAVLSEIVTQRLGHGYTIMAGTAADIQFANPIGAQTFTEVLYEEKV